MEYFVKPTTVRLQIGHGQFIDVKRRLNAGEQNEMYAIMAPHITIGEKALLETAAVMSAKILAYLVSWSLTDGDVPVPMTSEMSRENRLALINGLDPDVFTEIKDAIDRHEAAVDREMVALKNAQATGSVLPVISPSLG